MRCFLTAILTIIATTTFAYNSTQATDSLLNLLKTTHSLNKRIQIYRNLADINEDTPNARTYLLKMYEEAKKAKNKEAMLNALNDIVIQVSATYNKDNSSQKDTILKYINCIKEIAKPKELESLLPLYHMRFFDTLCYQGKSEEAINEELSFLNSKEKQDNIYKTIALDYTLGTSFYMRDQFAKSIPYLEKAIKLTATLPDKERYEYNKFIAYRLCFSLGQAGKEKEPIPIMENLIKEIELDFKMNYQNRPFFKFELYLLQYYSFMLSSLRHLTKQQEQYYWSRILEFSKNLTNPVAIYTFNLCANNYYTHNQDYPKAIAANDTLIKISKELAPRNLAGLYKINSELYEKIKNYPQSLNYLKLCYQTDDSIKTAAAHQQLNELQVKYDINSLNNEKAQLEIKNKKILVTSLSILLIIVIGICSYLYYSLKKEKRMKAELNKLHNKAQESEKMKQAFINSICHEIRTPLNSIVGFSDLITNDEIDEEMRREFPAEIQKNTAILTDLVNSMLEVANLDVSEDKLPCESADIRNICIQEMEKLPRKDKIEYKLNIPEDSLFISTNVPYLSQVIEHLLNNASKFTEHGHISLAYIVNKKEGNIQISVTDTGCGIPVEQQEEVFNRFYKLDTFSPGSGLGLYLCRLIVKRLAGEIKIDPDYTDGTRLIVILPLT